MPCAAMYWLQDPSVFPAGRLDSSRPLRLTACFHGAMAGHKQPAAFGIRMILHNRTELDTLELESLLRRHIDGWPHDGVTVFVRYSRSADFSGACYYNSGRLFINIGRHVRCPYRIAARIARAKTRGRFWSRQGNYVIVTSACQLVLYVFLHEFYHWLVKQAGRNLRQKEAMCDRFAARVLVDHYKARILDAKDNDVPRDSWDWQDLETFVRRAATKTPAASREVPVAATTAPAEAGTPAAG